MFNKQFFMLYVLKTGRLDSSLVAEASSKPHSKVLDVNRGYLLLESQKTLDFNHYGSLPIAFEVIERFNDFDVRDLASKIYSLGDTTNRFFLDSNFLTPKQLRLAAIDLKKMLVKTSDSKVSFFDFKNTASVFNESKKSKNVNGYGLYRLDRGYVLARFVFVQNIDAYTIRDFGKPFRDAKLGMLPPKLAQTMINLLPKDNIHTIYDPFCGTGTICFEAGLAGFSSWGSDLLDSNITGCNKNLDFFTETLGVNKNIFRFFQADATKLSKLPDNFAIVTEGYLGTPKKGNENKSTLALDYRSVVDIYNNFFVNLHKIAFDKKFFLVISVPEFKFLASSKNPEKIFANLRNYGYIFRTVVPSNRFGIDSSRVLHYSREDQFVSRNIICLEHIPG